MGSNSLRASEARARTGYLRGRVLRGQVTTRRRCAYSLALSDVAPGRGTDDPGLDRRRLVSFGWLMRARWISPFVAEAGEK